MAVSGLPQIAHAQTGVDPRAYDGPTELDDPAGDARRAADHGATPMPLQGAPTAADAGLPQRELHEPSTSARPADRPAGPLSPTGRRMVLAGQSLLGIGTAIAVTSAIGLGVAAHRKRVESRDYPEDDPRRDALEDERTGLVLAQVVATLGGAAIAATGAALWAVGRDKRVELAPEVQVGALGPDHRGVARPWVLGLTGRF